jgi:type IV secretion system protein VirB8
VNNGDNTDAGYYAAGQKWEDDLYRKLRRSRNFAWVATLISWGITALSILALVMLLPLKTFEPYMVVVDKTTGYTEISRALKPGDLSQEKAVTDANLVRYVRARETYDPRALKDNFDLALLYSTAQAAADLRQEFEPSNPKAKNKVYGDDVLVSVEVKSIAALNNTTATIRYDTITKTFSSERRESFEALIRYKYTSTPLQNQYRFDNPLGFQVTDFQRNQETIIPAAVAKP